MKDTYNDGYKTEDIKCIVVDFIAKDGKGGFPIMRQGIYVLCKDCKYWVKRKDYKDLCTYWAINTEEMDFCSRGEKE